MKCSEGKVSIAAPGRNGTPSFYSHCRACDAGTWNMAELKEGQGRVDDARARKRRLVSEAQSALERIA
jgi:hypothetical protein